MVLTDQDCSESHCTPLLALADNNHGLHLPLAYRARPAWLLSCSGPLLKLPVSKFALPLAQVQACLSWSDCEMFTTDKRLNGWLTQLPKVI